jgi:RimJ/RimL family protein N-acetyltransferase
VLRPFVSDDVDLVAPIFAKPPVWEFPYGRGFSRDETAMFLDQQLSHWDEYGFGCWLASEATTGRPLGYVGLSVPSFLPEILPAVEVGWRFDPDVWGRGYASEGAVAALHEGFETLRLSEICSVPQTENQASVRVAERIGMRLERVVEIAGNDRRGPVQGSLFWITADDWARRSQDATE